VEKNPSVKETARWPRGLTINGMPDQVHLLLSLRPKHSPAAIAREIKAGSSEWLHQELRRRVFGWQDGYFVCTLW
jgi:putative transposase